jgi:hypothetical protein
MDRIVFEDLLAQATGESRRVLRRRGFQLADPLDCHYDPEPSLYPPQAFDWDQGLARPVSRIA